MNGMRSITSKKLDTILNKLSPEQVKHLKNIVKDIQDLILPAIGDPSIFKKIKSHSTSFN